LEKQGIALIEVVVNGLAGQNNAKKKNSKKMQVLDNVRNNY
jgi:hypothetical protein